MGHFWYTIFGSHLRPPLKRRPAPPCPTRSASCPAPNYTLALTSQFYINMGIIKVIDQENDDGEKVKYIQRNKLGPDASLLSQGYHVRYTNPFGEFIQRLFVRSLGYAAWLILAPYMMLRKQQYPPYDYVWEFSSIALFAALFFLTYEVLQSLQGGVQLGALGFRLRGGGGGAGQ